MCPDRRRMRERRWLGRGERWGGESVTGSKLKAAKSNKGSGRASVKPEGVRASARLSVLILTVGV